MHVYLDLRGDEAILILTTNTHVFYLEYRVEARSILKLCT